MIDKNTITSIKEKLFNSKEFANSRTQRKLLDFLIQSYLNDEIVKETTIASEIFGRNSDIDLNNDPIVRVNMHYLRLKIKSYYDHEGKNDKYRLEIPKGHYYLQFNPISKVKKLTKSKSKKTLILGTTVINVLLISLVLYLWYYTSTIKKQLQYEAVMGIENGIWKEFFQNGFNTTIILGDHQFFSEYDNEVKKWRYIRDLSINSIEDFESFQNQFPNKTLNVSADSYFPDGCIWSLPPLLIALQPVQMRISLNRISRLTPQMLYESNIIFLGSMKTLGLLDRFLYSSNIEYQVPIDILYYKHEDGTQVDTLKTYYDKSSGSIIDYASAFKFPGPNNNVIIIIASFKSPGVPKLTKYLTNPSTLSQLEKIFIKKFKRVPQYFGIIAEVKGIEKTGFYIEVKHVKEINEKVKIW